MLEEEYGASRSRALRRDRGGGVRRRLDRPGPPRGLLDGRRVAVKIQYPGVAEALEADLRNAGTIVRLAKAIAPGLDPKAIADELRERVLEELDYEYEAQNQRTFARAYRDHPFIYVPDVYTRLSRRRVLVTELVEGIGFEQVKELDDEERSRFGEIVFRFCFGSIYHLQHFNADAHPGNYILMADGRVAFLDFGMTKKLDREQIELEQRAVDAAVRKDPEALREALHDLGFVKNPSKLDAERLMEHVMVVGGWYMEDREYEVSAAAGDEGDRVDLRPALGVLRPDAARDDAGRGADGPADGDRRARGPRPAAARSATGTGSCASGSTRDAPSTELGEQEWAYFEAAGVARTPGFAGAA